jgi:hypothetical protein
VKYGNLLEILYFFSTHRHGKLHHIHHILKQIESHNNCHNKCYHSLIQTAYQPKKYDNFDIRNKLHANVYLYNSNPNLEKNKFKTRLNSKKQGNYL